MVGSVGFCGDGCVDLGEECDDGNFIFGDGCFVVCCFEVMLMCGVGLLLKVIIAQVMVVALL